MKANVKTILLGLLAALVGTVQLHAEIPTDKKIRLTQQWEFVRQDMGSPWEVMRPARPGNPESVPLWQKVSLPHCFNAEDAVDPDVNYYQGPGWYRTTLDIDNPYAGGRTYLEFEGAGQKTEVYVYTTRVAQHVGGYDEWKADITEAVARVKADDKLMKRFGGKIPIAIRCDNSRDTQMIPSSMSDFNVYGGLYRYVNLVYVPAWHIEAIRIDSRTDEKGRSGEASITIQPETMNGQNEAEVSIRICSPDGKEVFSSTLESNEKGEYTTGFRTKRPCLWSPETPALYTCTVQAVYRSDTLTATERFGFRHFRFEEQGPFYLNGERYLLKGTHRHEDHAGTAAALTEEMMRHEMRQIKEMGANFIRLGHYQQSEIILDLCDELGLMVWEEIPWCRGGLGNTVYQEQARRMLTHMITQHRNHPSIILWGLGNENDWPGDFETFDKDSIHSFMSDLNGLAHQLDPSRSTVIRRCDFCKDIVDVYSPSIWAGWYSSKFTDYRAMTEKNMRSVPRFLHAAHERHIVLAEADSVIFRRKAFIQDTEILAGTADAVVGNQKIHHHSVDAAQFQIQQRRQVVLEFRHLREGSLKIRGGIQRFLRGRTGLQTHRCSGKIRQRLIRGICAHNHNLRIAQIRLGEAHGLFPLGRHRESVPDAVDFFRIQFHFLGGPVHRLQHKLYAHAAADFPRKIHVVPDNFVVVVAESHRRKGVIQTHDERAFFQHIIQRIIRTVLRTACKQQGRSGQKAKTDCQPFHIFSFF